MKNVLGDDSDDEINIEEDDHDDDDDDSATWIFTREINCYAIIRGISRHPGHGCWRSKGRCHTPRSL